MKEHLVAFAYIMVLACAAFALMAKPMTAHVMAKHDFALRRNVWIAVTVVAFLAHHFWLAMLLSGLIVAISARKESNPAALYCALLFAVPQFAMPIPGVGVINKLIEMDHPRMLALAILLPAALRLAATARAPNPRLRIADLLFGSYFVYVFVVNATADSITGLIRYVVYVLLDHVLLYFVITRSVISRRHVFDVMASFFMGVAVISVLAVFENLRSWLVYESLRPALGVPPAELSMYLLRATEDGGYFRALASTGNAIAMGFMAMIAVIWQLALARTYAPRLLGVAVVLIPVGGLLASVSRGPWLGCAIAVFLGVVFGPHAKRRILWTLASATLIIAALLIHPQGQKFIDLLPFIGSVEPGSVTYRTQLIDRAMIVFWQHPIFGSLQYINNPVMEVMRQGQGIIDIVNSYIGVALAYGSIGLVLFVAPSLWALLSAWITSRRLARQDPGADAAGRALAASMLAILLVIGAVSHYFHIPIVHWMVMALCSAFAAHAPAWQRAHTAQTQTQARRSPVVSTRPAGQPMARPRRHA